MNVIDRYIYAVTRYLPENIRGDVSKELQIKIKEMLPEVPTTDDVREVLEQLGNPRELANEYQPQKRYLIGPSLYDQYLSVLKLVLSVVAVVLVSVTVLTWGFNPSSEESVIQLLGKIITVTFEGLMQSAVWVTVIFVGLERSNVVPFGQKKWSIKDLPNIPAENNRKISRVEVIISMMMTVVLLSIFYFQPQIIAIYLDGGTRFPLFELERLSTYLPIIMLFGIVQIALCIWQWIAKYRTLKMDIIEAVFMIGNCIFLLVMLQDSLLFNPKLVAFFNDLNRDIPFARGFSVLVIIITLISVVNIVRKYKRYN